MVFSEKEYMDFPSNSKNPTDKSAPSKKTEKKVEQVVTAPVVQKKKPAGQRIKNLLTGVEFKNATQYVFMDVMIPAVKNMVVDAVDVGIKRMVYGENARNVPTRDSHRSKTTYNSPVNRGGPSTMLPKQPPHYSSPRSSLVANDIILNSRDEAVLVLSTMQDIIENYRFATVSDFHTILGLPSTYVDNNWGWSGLQYVDIRQVREGWLLDMPSTEPAQ